jgi:hypothetical protein
MPTGFLIDAERARIDSSPAHLFCGCDPPSDKGLRLMCCKYPTGSSLQSGSVSARGPRFHTGPCNCPVSVRSLRIFSDCKSLS